MGFRTEIREENTCSICRARSARPSGNMVILCLIEDRPAIQRRINSYSGFKAKLTSIFPRLRQSAAFFRLILY